MGRLILAPPDVLDYIVVHELAHLVELNHSAKFWLIVRSCCPEFERYKGWLREKGAALSIKTSNNTVPAPGYE